VKVGREVRQDSSGLYPLAPRFRLAELACVNVLVRRELRKSRTARIRRGESEQCVVTQPVRFVRSILWSRKGNWTLMISRFTSDMMPLTIRRDRKGRAAVQSRREVGLPASWPIRAELRGTISITPANPAFPNYRACLRTRFDDHCHRLGSDRVVWHLDKARLARV